MPLARLADVEIHYETVGAGPPLLLVSGLGGNASYWKPNLDALAAHHTVITHDHRGTGGSTRFDGAYSVELLAQDMLGLMDVLGIDSAAIIGHSTGGAIGQILAAEAPARVGRLMLYASWGAGDPQMEQCLRLRQRALALGGTLDYHRASPVFLYPPRYVREHWSMIESEIMAADRATTTPAILDARLEAILAFDGRPYHARMTSPTRILVAEDDILTPPYLSADLATAIAGSTLRQLPYGGHAVSRTDPVAFLHEVEDFLAR